MSKFIRTTVTLPVDLYEKLQAASFYQRKPISQLIREGVEKILPLFWFSILIKVILCI